MTSIGTERAWAMALTSSVKNRIAISMIETAEQSGKPALQIVVLEPATSAVLQGKSAALHNLNLQGIGAGFVPDVLRLDLVDEIIPVAEDQAYELGRKLAQVEGILSGISTGAALYAAIQVAQQPDCQGQMIVVMQPSSGERYLSTPMWHRK